MRAVLTLLIIVLSQEVYEQDLNFYNISDKIGISGDVYGYATEDCTGRIWIATKEGGIVITDGYSSENLDITDNLVSNAIKQVHVDNDCNVWITTSDGFSIISDDNSIKNYSYVIEKANWLPHHGVYGFTEDAEGIYWLGTDRGLVRFDKRNEVFETFKNGGKEMLFRVHSILQDPDNDHILWLGTTNGLHSFHKKTKLLKSYPIAGNIEPATDRTGEWVLYSLFKEEQEIFAGACWSGGLLQYSISKNRITQNLSTPTEVDAFRNNGLYSIHPIGDNYIIYSNDRGYGFYDRKNKKFHNSPLPGKDGNPQPGYHLLIDKKSYVWIISRHNIYKSTKPVKKETNITTSLPYIHSVSLNGTAYSTDISELPPDSNSVGIAIHTTNPSHIDSIEYRYQLLGFDKSVNYQKGVNNIEYKNLKYGDYEFVFSVLDPINREWKEGSPWKFKIPQPYYLTWWFILLILLLVSSLFYGSIKYAIARERGKKNARMEMAEAKLTALRAQMNPHFLFNSMNSINYFILNNESQKALDYLSRFSKILRMVLNNSKQNLISLEDELSAIKLYVEIEQVRVEGGFNFILNLDPEVDTKTTVIPPLIIQPFVENAIWHGIMPSPSKNSLTVTIAKSSVKTIIITIEDDGVGRGYHHGGQDLQTHKSFGTALTQDRILLIKEMYDIDASLTIEDLHNEESAPSGTRVTLMIPIFH